MGCCYKVLDILLYSETYQGRNGEKHTDHKNLHNKSCHETSKKSTIQTG